MKLNLSFNETFTNLVRNERDIYCFENNEIKKIRDLHHKVNQYNENFLF